MDKGRSAYKTRKGISLVRWRFYNALKQKIYRDKAPNSHHGQVGRPKKEVFSTPDHCKFCSMLLTSDYHNKHPLVGCEKYIHEYRAHIAKVRLSEGNG